MVKRRTAESFKVHCTATESGHQFKLETMWWQVWENLINSPSAQRTDSSACTWFLSAKPEYRMWPLLCAIHLKGAFFGKGWIKRTGFDPNTVCVWINVNMQDNIITWSNIKSFVFDGREIQATIRKCSAAISVNACNSAAFTAWMISVKNKLLTCNPFHSRELQIGWHGWNIIMPRDIWWLPKLRNVPHAWRVWSHLETLHGVWLCIARKGFLQHNNI